MGGDEGGRCAATTPRLWQAASAATRLNRRSTLQSQLASTIIQISSMASQGCIGFHHHTTLIDHNSRDQREGQGAAVALITVTPASKASRALSIKAQELHSSTPPTSNSS
ncbi:hypothetical protein EJB05_11767, partial [Eragrostis curvula]